MEEVRRQTQRQLDMVDRQITRRMTALIPDLLPRRTAIGAARRPIRKHSSSATDHSSQP